METTQYDEEIDHHSSNHHLQSTTNNALTHKDILNPASAANTHQEEEFPSHTEKAKTSDMDILNPVTICILAAETGERFAYFGFRALLVLYFTNELMYEDSQAVALFSFVSSLAYFSPIIGAIVADGGVGRYKTILTFGKIYVLGLVLLTFAAWHIQEVTPKRLVSFAGLFFACIGTGGIKPCVSAFGADQIALQPSSTTPRPFQEALSEKDGILVQPEKADSTSSLEDANERAERVRSFFNYFYFCINVGALTSIALVPLVRGHFGFGPAFLLATLFMKCALWLFWSKRAEYIHEEQSHKDASLYKTFQLTAWLFHQYVWNCHPDWQAHFAWARPGPMPSVKNSTPLQRQRQQQHTMVPTKEEDEPTSQPTLSRHDESQGDENEESATSREANQQLEDAAQALHVLPVMAMFPIFWCLYDQQGSVWTLQATRMTLPSWLQPEQLNVINPLEIMIFIPLFDQIIYPALRRARWNLNPLRRMSWGMVLTALAFCVSGWVESALQHRLDNNLEPVHVGWQLIQITVLAVGEIFVSVTGLEFAYATSPARLKAFLMAIFLLTTAVGDLLSGVLYSSVFASMNRADVMYSCAGLMLVNWAIFGLVASWYNKHTAADLRLSVSFEEVELPPYSSAGRDGESDGLIGDSSALVGGWHV